MRTAALVSILIATLVASPIVNRATDLTEVAGVADSADLEMVDELVCEVILGCKPNQKADTRRGGNKRKDEKEILDVEVEESEELDVSVKVEEQEEEEEIDVIITEETQPEEPEQASPYSKKNNHGMKKSGKKGSRY